jgi:hypothetical protein
MLASAAKVFALAANLKFLCANQQIVLNDLIFEGGSGVRDWANLQQRLRFIADLFRTCGEEKCLFDPLKADTTGADS